MARITDPSKLERIKSATVSMIVEKGYGGASISNIAAHAGVADGYLYRHYQGKAELIRSLFDDSMAVFTGYIEEELGRYTDFGRFITAYHRGLVQIVNGNPDNTKFFIQLINDFTFDIGATAKQQVMELCGRVLERGRRNHEIPETCSILDIYTIMLIIPLQVFSLYLKDFFGKVVLDDSIAAKVTGTCLKIVQ